MCRCIQHYTWMKWLLEHEELLTLLVSFLSFVATTILTMVIIVQTSKLAKKQSEQERLIHKQQEDLQKRQIRIDTFDYKNNIYRALYKVFQMTGEIEETFEKINLQEKRIDQLHQLFDILRSQLGIDVSETLWIFKQAEYILPSNIYASIYDIAGNFNELSGDIAKLALYPSILNENEIETEKNALLDDILERAKQINSHTLFINSVMEQELNISCLDK